MSDTLLTHRTIVDLAGLLGKGELSPVELTRAFLARIERLEGRTRAFVRVCPERALASAEKAERALSEGREVGALHGIPYVAKDLFDVRGLPTTAGTRLLEGNLAHENAAAVDRLEAAGMVLLGKAATVQLAYGGAGINHDQGTPHNPWHEVPHLPGGSSSGTAVAIAAGLAPGGLGTDTGGSVRIPASFCGITGLKTAVGRVDRAGVYLLSQSLDTVGPLARTVEDVTLLQAALVGADPPRLEPDLRGLRICFAESAFWDGADDEVVRAVRASGRVFEGLGARVSSIEFPEAAAALAVNPKGLAIAAEAYANNRRLLDEHFDELDPIVSRRMIQGKHVLAHEYLQATRDWQRLRRQATEALRDVDALLCPTTIIPAPPLDRAERDLESYFEVNLQCVRNTAIGNLLDLCGLSVPCGFTSGGLPIGLMIYGKSTDELVVLRAGHAYQQATDWHRRTPGFD